MALTAVDVEGTRARVSVCMWIPPSKRLGAATYGG